MSFLAVQVKAYLDTTPVTARQLEDMAGLPRMTVGNILNDTHPRPERFGQLLRAVVDATACRWLNAYLRDVCPAEYLPRLEIIVRTLKAPTAPTAYTTSQPDHGPLAVLAGWQRLQSVIQSDSSLALWFVKTVNLILGPA